MLARARMPFLPVALPALLLAAAVASCSGGQKPPAEPPIGNDPGPGQPGAPGPHAGTCYWGGKLTATIAPMHGDSTCFQARPLEVQLHGPNVSSAAAAPELGMIVIQAPAATGTSTDGDEVSIQGGIDQCEVQLQLSYTFPVGNRSMFASFSVSENQSTGQVTGSGSVSVFCADDKCHCEAQATIDGAIVVE